VRPASLDVGLQDRLCYAKYFLSQKLGSRACPGAISPRILQLPQLSAFMTIDELEREYTPLRQQALAVRSYL
jgi:hypothetical protein